MKCRKWIAEEDVHPCQLETGHTGNHKCYCGFEWNDFMKEVFE